MSLSAAGKGLARLSVANLALVAGTGLVLVVWSQFGVQISSLAKSAWTGLFAEGSSGATARPSAPSPNSSSAASTDAAAGSAVEGSKTSSGATGATSRARPKLPPPLEEKVPQATTWSLLNVSGKGPGSTKSFKVSKGYLRIEVRFQDPTRTVKVQARYYDKAGNPYYYWTDETQRPVTDHTVRVIADGRSTTVWRHSAPGYSPTVQDECYVQSGSYHLSIDGPSGCWWTAFVQPSRPRRTGRDWY